MTASISPALAAALSTRNQGTAVASAMSRPAPSAPSRAPAGTRTAVAGTAADALPRRPIPTENAGMVSPGDPDGTSHKVIAPSAATGRLDQT